MEYGKHYLYIYQWQSFCQKLHVADKENTSANIFLCRWQTLLSVNSSVLSVGQLRRGQIGHCEQCFSNWSKIHFSTQHQTQYIITCTQQSTYMCKQGPVLVQFIGGAICFTFRSRWIILFWWQCWTASSTCWMQLLQIQVAVERYRLPAEILSSQLHHGRSHYEQWRWTKWSPQNMIQFLAYFTISGVLLQREIMDVLVTTKLWTLSVLMAIFPGKLGLAGFIEAKDIGTGDDNWSYKTWKAPVKLSSPTNQHPLLQARCPSCRPTNSVKALKGISLKLLCA